MQFKHKLIISIIPFILLLSGCLERDPLVPVQEYKGEDYKVSEPKSFSGFGTKPIEIAEENEGKVIASVKRFYLTEFKTDVQVRNIVNASNGVVVYTESVGKPQFYSSVEVPINTKTEEIKIDRIIAEELRIEGAINSGLYAMAYEEKFATLDSLFDEVAQEQPIVGLHMEVIRNTHGYSYETPYYYLKVRDDSLAEAYLKNPDITKEEVRALLESEDFDSENDVSIVTYLHMKEPDVEPDERVYDEIYQRIEQANGIPAGKYSFKLYDNQINRFHAIGDDSNSIDKTIGNSINKK